MEPGKKVFGMLLFLFEIFFCISCNKEIDRNIQKTDRKPNIEPDYSDVTIPPNIAPMNFKIRENGKYFRVIVVSGSNGYQLNIKSSDGVIRFPEKSWKKLIGNSKDNKITIQIYSSDDKKILKQFDPFYFHVANEPIDHYLAYRLIYPGYYNWSHIRIM
ncbi:MAG: hypothetical protein MUO72_17480 [Bacteroidales bacterium]|nr:hypothetical protein [Bacteroidales bacterium]